IFAALVWLAFQYRRLYHALARPLPIPPAPSRYPSLTIVRTIRGLDFGARANVEALLASEYPAPLELLFVLDDAKDPAYAEVKTLVARHRASHPLARTRVLLAGAPPPGRTGKLHAMSVGVHAASGELVGFSDSDTRVEREQLRALVDDLLAVADSGAVFAPAVAAQSPRTLGDAGYALMLNSWYGAVAAAAAGETHELPFIMGQLMIFRREALAAIGGVECADGQLVDDMYLGQRIVERGYRNVMSGHRLSVISGELSVVGFVQLMRRWLLFSRSGLPTRFKRPAWIHGLVLGVLVAAFVGSLAMGWHGPALFAALTLALGCVSDVALHRELGGAPIPFKWWWVTLTVPVLGPFALGSLLFDRHVDWRGRDYRLDGGAHLGRT
ncbi:MAG TPA: glycosyltransferase, partial [Polyangia bacterium]|nr:glycosyltransferase [Polyangia bacterium]